MSNFYAFDGDRITLLGDFPGIGMAMDHEPSGTVWVFSEVGLADLWHQIYQLVPSGETELETPADLATTGEAQEYT